MTLEELKDIAEGAKRHPLGCSCHGCCQGQDKSPSEKLAEAGADVLDLIKQLEDSKQELEKYKKAVAKQLHYDMNAVISDTPENIGQKKAWDAGYNACMTANTATLEETQKKLRKTQEDLEAIIRKEGFDPSEHSAAEVIAILGKEESKLSKQVRELEAENDKLRARPPMHCSTCEDHNMKLWDEIEAHKAFMTREGREGIALNAYIAGIDDSTNIPVEDLLSSERMQPYINKFKRWWKGYEDVIELRAKPYVDKVLANKS